MPQFETKITAIGEHFERKPIFGFLDQIRQEFSESEIFLVGGGVRDLLLERPCKDYDFVIRGVDAKRLQDFLSRIGIVNLVGRVFGVFKFIPEAHYEKFKEDKLEAFDLALPRTEHAYLSGGYRDFEVQSDASLPVEKDLERRDFTINAIAVKVGKSGMMNQKSMVVDPFGGLKDLEEGLIRAVRNPDDRFREDFSRMLRALRFACQLDFAIEEKTFGAIKKNIGALNKQTLPVGMESTEPPAGEWVVPRETIAKEMLKSFYANPLRAFDLYDQSGAFEILTPEVVKMKECPQPPEFHSEGDVFAHTRLALTKLQSEEYKKLFGEEKPNAELIIALLLHDIGKPPTLKTPEEHGTERIRFDEHNEVGAKMAKEIIRRLKLESQAAGTPLHISADRISWLLKNHLLLLLGDPKEMRVSTVEKYFFNPLNPGDELIRLSYCDARAAIPQGDEPVMQNFNAMVTRIEEVGKLAREKKRLPPPLLDGEEIMKILNIKPGPEVGRVILALREEQLEGKITHREGAIDFINSKFKSQNAK